MGPASNTRIDPVPRRGLIYLIGVGVGRSALTERANVTCNVISVAAAHKEQPDVDKNALILVELLRRL
jgi:hypothetical protein